MAEVWKQIFFKYFMSTSDKQNSLLASDRETKGERA